MQKISYISYHIVLWALHIASPSLHPPFSMTIKFPLLPLRPVHLKPVLTPANYIHSNYMYTQQF